MKINPSLITARVYGLDLAKSLKTVVLYSFWISSTSILTCTAVLKVSPVTVTVALVSAVYGVSPDTTTLYRQV